MVLKVQRYQINSVDYLLKTKQTVAITLCCMGISPKLEHSLLENTRAPETHEVRKTSKFSEPMLRTFPRPLSKVTKAATTALERRLSDLWSIPSACYTVSFQNAAFWNHSVVGSSVKQLPIGHS